MDYTSNDTFKIEIKDRLDKYAKFYKIPNVLEKKLLTLKLNYLIEGLSEEFRILKKTNSKK